MAFRLSYTFAGAVAAALLLGAGAPLAAQQDTSSARSGVSQDTTHKAKAKTKTTKKHRRSATRRTNRTSRTDSLRARTDTSGYRAGQRHADTSGYQAQPMGRDTSRSMMQGDTSMMRTDTSRSMMRTDTSMMRSDTSRSMQGDTSGYSPGRRDTSGVTPNRAGLPGDSAHAHPGAEPLRTQTERVQTDSMTRQGSTANPPGIQSPPAGDSTMNRGEMNKPGAAFGGSRMGDTTQKHDSTQAHDTTKSSNPY
ncbi:MAG TPA: hypothetical protein VFS40_06855 [Gemmatimonadales bacterium]|nr:hypothetical protein [Gemmatimonadales bacterium]